MYPYCIIIMTTNKTPQYFDDIDPSYMRQCRINLKYELTKNE